DGSFANKTFQIGANQGQNITVSIAKMDAEGIGLNDEITVTQHVPKQIASNEAFVSGNQLGGTTLTADVNLDVVKEGDDVVAIKVGDDYYAIDDVTVAADGSVTVT